MSDPHEDNYTGSVDAVAPTLAYGLFAAYQMIGLRDFTAMRLPDYPARVRATPTPAPEVRDSLTGLPTDDELPNLFPLPATDASITWAQMARDAIEIDEMPPEAPVNLEDILADDTTDTPQAGPEDTPEWDPAVNQSRRGMTGLFSPVPAGGVIHVALPEDIDEGAPEPEPDFSMDAATWMDSGLPSAARPQPRPAYSLGLLQEVSWLDD